ncbi:MAG: type II and III secretion system protein [Bdellovibrionales bacterium]|nr:type II and III secretion system protein [Bdellovibrionales bacterium]
MKITTLLAAILLNMNLALAETLYLSVGQSHIINTNAQSPVSLGNGKVLKIQDQGNRLQVLALAKGHTWLQIGPAQYEVMVVSEKSLNFFKELNQTLRSFRGIKAHFNQLGTVEITGDLLRAEDWTVVTGLAHKHQAGFAMRAKIHPLLVNELTGWKNSLLQELGLSSNQLELFPEPKAYFNNAEMPAKTPVANKLKQYGFQIELNEGQLSQVPSVQLEIMIAEVDKTFERELGLRWGDNGKYSTQILPEARWNVLSAELAALESNGTGQILAKPRLLSRSGEKAEFHAGGEIPIRIAGWGNQNVQWKKHGIIMNFQPLADHRGAMKLSVEIEISVPNLSQMVGQLPTFETNRVKSQFDLASKKTIVLSGLIRKSKSQSQEGLPYLSRIPVLGRLFGSPRYQSRQTELIVFVTPEVLSYEELPTRTRLPEGMEE